MEHEKLVLIKESEKDQILVALNTLVEEIHTGTATLKKSILEIQSQLDKEVESFDKKISNVTANLMSATMAIETLLGDQ